jgi:hypothetical protein
MKWTGPCKKYDDKERAKQLKYSKEKKKEFVEWVESLPPAQAAFISRVNARLRAHGHKVF